MPSASYMNGLSSVYRTFSVLLSDYDGNDIVAELMEELDVMSDEEECQGRPVPVYIMTGTIGAIRTEMLFFYMLGGVPLILSPAFAVTGTGVGDAKMTLDGGRLLAAMYSRNNNFVYSVGYVDSPAEAYAAAVEYTRTNVPTPDPGIDRELVESYIAGKGGAMLPLGVIEKPGGTRLEVYAFDETESSMFRPDKDFMGGRPDEESGRVRGKTEVILYGGNPDIVCVGGICSADGAFFDVWVPNEKGYIDCARHMIEQGDIPRDTLYIDEDDLAQAYVMYDDKLRSDEAKSDEEDEDTDVPDFDYEEFYTEQEG